MSHKTPLQEKYASESRIYDFECLSLCDDDETIDTVSSLTATPVTVPALVLGTPNASGTRVQVRVSEGKSGTKYNFSGVVITSAGNTLEIKGALNVL